MCTKVVGIGRASTKDQEITRDVQETKIREYCQLYNLELVGFYYDAGVTGKTTDRPALQAALRALEEGKAEGVIVYKLDRLTRSLADLNTLVEGYFKERFALISVCEQLNTKSASGRLVLNILASVAQWEADVISERTKEALQAKRNRGEATNHVPFGYEIKNKKMVKNPKYYPVVELILELRKTDRTLPQIADYLNKSGYRSASGCYWYPSTVNAVLKREQEVTKT